MKICVCLGAEWQKQWPIYLLKADLIELRIDLMFPSGTAILDILEELKPLFIRDPQKIVLTCRTGVFSQEERLNLFLSLMPFSPKYVDIEVTTPLYFCRLLIVKAHQCGVQIISSYHEFEGTPHVTELYQVSHGAIRYGADLVKIVTHCHNSIEEAVLLSLYKDPFLTNRIIAFSLGRFGLSSRLQAAALGAPILYVAPDNGVSTAPGQPGFTQFLSHLA